MQVILVLEQLSFINPVILIPNKVLAFQHFKKTKLLECQTYRNIIKIEKRITKNFYSQNT